MKLKEAYGVWGVEELKISGVVGVMGRKAKYWMGVGRTTKEKRAFWLFWPSIKHFLIAKLNI